ncbi:hypothetical protein [Thermococcus sp.]
MRAIVGKVRSRWVTGLRPKVESVLRGRISDGMIVGRAMIRGMDMLEVVEVSFVPGENCEPSVQLKGNEVVFAYPVQRGQSVEDVYYPLMGLLNRV